jgi:hypothetical protein
LGFRHIIGSAATARFAGGGLAATFLPEFFGTMNRWLPYSKGIDWDRRPTQDGRPLRLTEVTSHSTHYPLTISLAERLVGDGGTADLRNHIGNKTTNPITVWTPTKPMRSCIQVGPEQGSTSEMVAAASTPPDKRDANPPLHSGNRWRPRETSIQTADSSMVAPLRRRTAPLTSRGVPSAAHSPTIW